MHATDLGRSHRREAAMAMLSDASLSQALHGALQTANREPQPNTPRTRREPAGNPPRILRAVAVLTPRKHLVHNTVSAEGPGPTTNAAIKSGAAVLPHGGLQLNE